MKEILENIGLSMAAYSEGYIALAEDAITHGRELKISFDGKKAYFIYEIDDRISCWGLYFKDEVLGLLAHFDTADRLSAQVESFFAFDSCPARGAVKIKFLNRGNPELDLCIYAEIINFMLAQKNEKNFGEKIIAATLNGFISSGTLKTYKDEVEYYRSCQGGPALDENAIVVLKSVNRDETSNEELARAHLCATLKELKVIVNPYSRERFFNLTVSCRGFKIDLFTAYNECSRKLLSKAAMGNIIEGDVYFAAKL